MLGSNVLFAKVMQKFRCVMAVASVGVSSSGKGVVCQGRGRRRVLRGERGAGGRPALQVDPKDDGPGEGRHRRCGAVPGLQYPVRMMLTHAIDQKYQ